MRELTTGVKILVTSSITGLASTSWSEFCSISAAAFSPVIVPGGGVDVEKLPPTRLKLRQRPCVRGLSARPNCFAWRIEHRRLGRNEIREKETIYPLCPKPYYAERGRLAPATAWVGRGSCSPRFQRCHIAARVTSRPFGRIHRISTGPGGMGASPSKKTGHRVKKQTFTRGIAQRRSIDQLMVPRLYDPSRRVRRTATLPNQPAGKPSVKIFRVREAGCCVGPAERWATSSDRWPSAARAGDTFVRATFPASSDRAGAPARRSRKTLIKAAVLVRRFHHGTAFFGLVVGVTGRYKNSFSDCEISRGSCYIAQVCRRSKPGPPAARLPRKPTTVEQQLFFVQIQQGSTATSDRPMCIQTPRACDLGSAFRPD